MKKFASLLLSLLLTLALCACGNGTEATVDNVKTPETEAPAVSETPRPEVTAEPAALPSPEASQPPDAAGTVTLIDADAAGFNLPEDRICVLDAQGMKILIRFNGDAKQVTLRAPVYDDNLYFVGTGDIYAAFGDVQSGEAVGLRVYIPDVLPNVVLCYTDSLGQHCYGIFQSGEDGSLLLTDMRAAAGLN